MRGSDALVVGEALVDIVTAPDGTTTQHPGGSAANVAVALARLGRPVRFATALADDAHGRLLVQHLTADGVRLIGEPQRLARTSTAHATLAPDGSARYDFDLDWRLGALDPGRPRVLHVCSLGAVLAPGADAVLALLEGVGAGVLVSYDINVRPSITGAGPDLLERVERVVRRAHVVKASDEDLRILHPDRDLLSAAQHLLGLGPRAVVVTEGAAGASWFSASGVVHVAAPAVTVVDTIGAGDTFSAALLDALWDDPDRDPGEVLRHAARAAAVTVSRAGANPPYGDEL
ncbi:carbohydrate kinase [Nocardioides sp. BP30]|uniref:carbohydrate kinase family protein n=1 Tax=Nocardioides sp. BP30 TaxID=3036374 RepID=UPI0024695719|nr:carbohydrate kinase [Nocardioides sp. BP30]WGL52157.1 carbohydrate kinase [Nocardioides sp. BP30]